MSFTKICATKNVDFVECICDEFPEMIIQVTQDIFVEAIEKRKYNFVERLVASGIDVNKFDSLLRSPLETAWNDDKLVKIILHRQDIELVIHSAMLYLNCLRMFVNRPELLELALETDYSMRNKREVWRAFLEACNLGILDSIWLITRHPTINRNDITSMLARIKSSRNPNDDIIKLLESRL